MKKKVASVLVLVLAFSVMMAWGCSSKEKEQNRQRMIIQQIDTLNKEIQGMQEQQAKLKETIQSMKTQIDAMDQELTKVDPRLFAAKGTLEMMRTTVLAEDTGIMWLMANLQFSAYILVLVLVVWLFYRMRHRHAQSQVS